MSNLVAVPSDWGPSVSKYRYGYSGDRVVLSIRAAAPWCRKSTDVEASVNP
jgi:hypothetical protein